MSPACFLLAAVIVLSGCASAGTEPGEPGSLTAHLHGENVVTFGTGWH